MAGFTLKVKKDFNMRKWDEFKKSVEGADKLAVNVGLPDNAKETDGTSSAMIGAAHEFGVPEHKLPERPWLRPGIITNKADFVVLNRINLMKVLQGKMTIQIALKQLGAMAAGRVQQYIKAGDFTKLKDATVKRKGRTNRPDAKPENATKPLIDIGQMVQGVTFEVVPKGKE